MELIQKRVQSPSSIKTYKQCPRKYYYQYIEKLETLPNIHLVRGKVTHEVLEHFFESNFGELNKENIDFLFKDRVQNILVTSWKNAKTDFDALTLSNAQKVFYFEETMKMLLSWAEEFAKKVKRYGTDLQTAFKELTPIRETQYSSERLAVRGIIDTIENYKGEIRLMDYKTSSSFDIEEHKLQLAIYSLLYSEKHGKLPDKVGIYYLKSGERFIDPDETLLKLAEEEIKFIHEKTQSRDKIDYSKNITPLCKWSTGQCDFHGVCFSGD